MNIGNYIRGWILDTIPIDPFRMLTTEYRQKNMCLTRALDPRHSKDPGGAVYDTE